VETAAAKEKTIGSVTFLVPSDDGADKLKLGFGRKSPVGNPELAEAVRHLCDKVNWFADGRVGANVVRVPPIDDRERNGTVLRNLYEADVLIAMVGSDDDSSNDLEYVRGIFEARRNREPQLRRRQCQFAIEISEGEISGGTIVAPLPAMVGPYDEDSPSLQSRLLPWTQAATAKRLHEQMMGLFGRWTTDDFCCAVLLFFNQFVAPVPWVQHSIDATWEKGPIRNARELYAMATKCGDCVGRCLGDDNCRECITRLTEVDSRDQVMSYRTIVSYESELLQDFSFCILQKNNVFGCDAEIPALPRVTPMSKWRRRSLTAEVARSILVGHLDVDEAEEELAPSLVKRPLRLPASWKVACGANVAYDQ